MNEGKQRRGNRDQLIRPNRVALCCAGCSQACKAGECRIVKETNGRLKEQHTQAGAERKILKETAPPSSRPLRPVVLSRPLTCPLHPGTALAGRVATARAATTIRTRRSPRSRASRRRRRHPRAGAAPLAGNNLAQAAHPSRRRPVPQHLPLDGLELVDELRLVWQQRQDVDDEARH